MIARAETTTVLFGHIDVVIRDLETDRELDHGLFATWDETGAEEFAERRAAFFNHRRAQA